MKKIVVAAILMSACAPVAQNYRAIDGFAEGTTYSIVYSDTVDLQPRIDSLLLDFDFSLSIYNPSSLITALNENSRDSVDEWFTECFEQSVKIHRESGGLFEPTLRPLIAAYGFGGKEPQRLSAAQIDSVKTLIGFDRLKIEDGRLIKADSRIQIDFNAIAKGYSVDIVGRMLDSMGIKNYMVEIGGEIYARGVNAKGEAWRIGIDMPYEGNFTPGESLQTIINVSDRGLATSGNYRKFLITDSGDRVTHTIDPRTMKPAHHNLLSATILAPTCTLADGYATACMVGGLEWAKSFVRAHKQIDCYLIYADADGAMKSYSSL